MILDVYIFIYLIYYIIFNGCIWLLGCKLIPDFHWVDWREHLNPGNRGFSHWHRWNTTGFSDNIIWLVVDLPLWKYESVGMTIPNIWTNKKSSKPPISYIYISLEHPRTNTMNRDFMVIWLDQNNVRPPRWCKDT